MGGARARWAWTGSRSSEKNACSVGDGDRLAGTTSAIAATAPVLSVDALTQIAHGDSTVWPLMSTWLATATCAAINSPAR